MALSNVAFNDTFEVWRARTNQLVAINNLFEASNVLNFVSNSSPITISASAIRYGTIYLALTSSNSVSDVSSVNVASTKGVNTAHMLAVSAFNNANTTLVTASAAFNNANTTLLTASAAFAKANAAPDIANSYAVLVGTAGNNYASGIGTGVGTGANSYATSVGTSGNAYALATATAVGTAGNVYAASVGVGANTYALAAFNKANTAASNTVNGIVELATIAEFRAATDPNRVAPIEVMYNSGKEVSVSSAATMNIDFSLGVNFNIELAIHATLGTPTNVQPGKAGRIRIRQTIGSNTMSYATIWNFAGGTAPTLSTGLGNNDILYYDTIDSSNIYASLSKNEY